MSDSNNPQIINAKGLKCPMPVIKLQQAVRKAESAAEISIACTDLGAEKDIASWAKVNKHQLTAVTQTEYGLLITIKVDGMKTI